MLVPPGEIHNLGCLGLGDLVSVDSANPDAALMHMQHDVHRFLPALLLKNRSRMNDELHRSVVVVQRRIESLANLTSSIMSGYAGFVHQGGGDQEGLANCAYRC